MEDGNSEEHVEHNHIIRSQEDKTGLTIHCVKRSSIKVGSNNVTACEFFVCIPLCNEKNPNLELAF